nr:hypothetical protein [Acidobacteriota bacterium]
ALAAAAAPGLVTANDTTVARLESLGGWLSSLGKLVSAADQQVLAGLTKGPFQEASDIAQQMRANAQGLEASLADRDTKLDDLAQQIEVQASAEVKVDATTTGNANTFQRYYISADLGFLYAWRVSKVVPYAGTNIYFRPINTNVPLSQKGGFWRRFSLTLGYTLQGIADQGNATRRDFVDGGGSLVAGAGLRLTESIRFSAGTLLFFKKDRNPLLNHEAVAAAPYVSFSFDLNVAKTFTKIGEVFFSK